MPTIIAFLLAPIPWMNLKGLVTVSDVLVQIMQRPSESSIQDIIKLVLKEPVLVPESIPLMKLLNVLRTEGVHEVHYPR